MHFFYILGDTDSGNQGKLTFVNAYYFKNTA